MEIKREKYLNELINRRNNGLIKVITGLRRSGKSYLLFNIYYDYLIKTGVNADNIITIPLDDYDYSELCDPGRLYEYIKERIKDKKQTYYIFIDEAQYAISKEELKNPDIPIRLYGVLNGLLRRNNTDVYITGSNSKFLSSDILTEFRGRGDEVHVAPLSFSEYLPASKKDKRDAWQDYLIYGGLPHIFSEPDDTAKSSYLERLNREGIVETRYMEHETRKRSQLEVDFIVNRNSERYYIQSAFSLPTQEKINQECAALIRIPDSFKKIIITNNNTPVWRDEHGITFLNLFDFLLDENSLSV